MKRQFFGMLTVAMLSIAWSAFADQTEIDADKQFYGATIFEHEKCRVEIVLSGPDEEKIYVRDEVIAIITFINDGLAYLESYSGGMLMGEYSYKPMDEQSVLERDKHIDQLLQSRGVPALHDLSDPLACLQA